MGVRRVVDDAHGMETACQMAAFASSTNVKLGESQQSSWMWLWFHQSMQPSDEDATPIWVTDVYSKMVAVDCRMKKRYERDWFEMEASERSDLERLQCNMEISSCTHFVNTMAKKNFVGVGPLRLLRTETEALPGLSGLFVEHSPFVDSSYESFMVGI